MKVHELGLCSESELRLARLAMAVEVHCKQRFSVRKNVMDVAAMLVVAEASEHALVAQRRMEFMDSLQPAVRKLVGGLIGEDEVIQQPRGAMFSQISAGTLYRGGKELLDGSCAANDARSAQLYRSRLAG